MLRQPGELASWRWRSPARARLLLAHCAAQVSVPAMYAPSARTWPHDTHRCWHPVSLHAAAKPPRCVPSGGGGKEAGLAPPPALRARCCWT